MVAIVRATMGNNVYSNRRGPPLITNSFRQVGHWTFHLANAVGINTNLAGLAMERCRLMGLVRRLNLQMRTDYHSVSIDRMFLADARSCQNRERRSKLISTANQIVVGPIFKADRDEIHARITDISFTLHRSLTISCVN